MTTYRGPGDPELRVAWQRARREAARQHHPDVGGVEAVYVDQMRQVDLRFAAAGGGSEGTRGRLRRRTARIAARGRHRLRRRIRATQGQLPRRVPGSRRYIDL